MRDEVVTVLIAALGRPEVSAQAAGEARRVMEIRWYRSSRSRLADEGTPVEARRELPQVL